MPCHRRNRAVTMAGFQCVKFSLGAAAVVLGADLLVDSASALARLAGVSERINGHPDDGHRHDEPQIGGHAAYRVAHRHVYFPLGGKRFQVKAGEVTVSVDPASSYLVETRVIDGVKYLLIPSGNAVEVNGLPVSVGGEAPEE